MLKRRRDVFAFETGDILPHVASENLVKRGRLFACSVQRLERCPLGHQIRSLQGLNQIPVTSNLIVGLDYFYMRCDLSSMKISP